MYVITRAHAGLTLTLDVGGTTTQHSALPGETEAALWTRVVGLQPLSVRSGLRSGTLVATIARPGMGLFQCRAYHGVDGARCYALSETARLLVLGCSATKRPDAGLLPALERYDGPSFRVLRRWRRANPAAAQRLDVRVLSAEYGLLHPLTREIPDYDRRMTAERAAALQPAVMADLATTLAHGAYSALLVHLGADYLPALGAGLFPQPLMVSATAGGIGERLGQLKHWLETPCDPLVGFVPAAYQTYQRMACDELLPLTDMHESAMPLCT